MNKLILKPLIKKNDGRFCKIDFYCKYPYKTTMNREEIKEHLEDGWEIKIDMSAVGKSINYKSLKITEYDVYMRLLTTFEKRIKEGDTQFLNRIIRNGGFINYINKLEKK